MKQDDEANPFQALEPINDTPIAPATGIGALALNFALKYHDINHIHDGALYQQFKLEGHSIEWVLHTAKQFERHLMETPNRLSALVLEIVAEGLAEEIAAEGGDAEDTSDAELGPGKDK